MMSRGPHLLHSAPPQCLNGPKSNWFIFDIYYLDFINTKNEKSYFYFYTSYFLFSQSPLTAWMDPKEIDLFSILFLVSKKLVRKCTSSPFSFSLAWYYEYKVDKWIYFFLFLTFSLSQFLLKAWMYSGANDLFWLSITCLHTFQESAHTLKIKMPNLNPNKLIFFPLIQFSQPLIKGKFNPNQIMWLSSVKFFLLI